MNNYTNAILILLLALVLTIIALYMAIVAMGQLKTKTILEPNTDVSYVNGILIMFIIFDSLWIVGLLYGIAKIRTSNLGGMFGFIIAIIVSFFAIFFGINAMNKTDAGEFDFVYKTLAANTFFIPLAVFLIVVSIWIKPRIVQMGITEKILKKTKETISGMNSDMGSSDQEIYEETVYSSDSSKPVAKYTKVIEPVSSRSYSPPAQLSSSQVLRSPAGRKTIIES